MTNFFVELAKLILVVAIVFVIYGFVAWVLSAGIAFVFGYEIGFWRTLVGIFLVTIASKLVFSGLNRS
jgi:hypothetical protein